MTIYLKSALVVLTVLTGALLGAGGPAHALHLPLAERAGPATVSPCGEAGCQAALTAINGPQVEPGPGVPQDETRATSDILRLSLITAGAVAGAALLGLLFTAIRHLIGYEPHRPGSSGWSEHSDGH